MNVEWSDLCKKVKTCISKEASFDTGINTLLDLRAILMEQILSFRKDLRREDFNAIPFMNAKGYHNKTIAYSLYHVFRIEDIVCNTLIKKNQQIFFSHAYCKKMNSPIITTGNELVKQQISLFSSKLNIDELYLYISDVNICTTQLLKGLSYKDLKTQITEQDKKLLESLNVVSTDDNAIWLIDYWCNKNIGGLIKMPFSRHWIMHIEASIRIRDKILNK